MFTPIHRVKTAEDPMTILSTRARAILSAAAPRIIATQFDLEPLLERVDQLMQRTDRPVRLDLELALRVFDSRLAGMILIMSSRTFTKSPEALQIKRIDAARRSRLVLFRTMYLAMQRLLLSCHYSDPRHYGEAGYPGPPSIERLEKA